MLADITIRNSTNSIKSLMLQYFETLALSFFIALFIHNTWIESLDIYHTILELICVFIAMAIFVSVWFLYNRNSVSCNVLGLGYLAIGIFDILHTFYFLKLNLVSSSYFDLSTKFWILGRLTEAAVLLLSVQLVSLKLNKWINLLVVLGTTLGISCFIVIYGNHLPVLLTSQGVTPLKMMLEYGIICLYAISLYKIKDKLDCRGVITYKYIFISLLMSISSEFCFTIYTSVDSISWTVGHILKITSYFFLFRGIFISIIVYPYNQLEAGHKNLEETTKKLKYTSETLSDLLDALPIAVKEHDLSGRVKYVNKKFEELFGCGRDELYGLTEEELLEKFPRIEGDERQLPHRVIQDGKDTKTIVRTYRDLKGDNIKLSINSERVRNGVLIFFSETKKEQELENLHIQTETILEAVDNCILMVDKNEKVVLCNRALEEVLETDKKYILGMDINKFKELIQFQLKENPYLISKDYIKRRLYEVSLVSLKGSEKHMLLYCTNIRNVDGDLIGNINISTDITTLKKEQQKLMQQEKLALLGQMGAAIVHETRNFLTTIKGRSQLISSLAKNEDVKKHALKINEEVDEVNRIISEFLFLSKPRKTEMTEVSMIDIFQSIESMVKSSSLVKGIDVDFQLSKEERYVMCDEAELKQVILNICKNAADAMADKNNARLKIETGFNESTNEMFIRITDNGEGISEENLAKIGTPFFTTKKNGTGLGLNVSYKIIKEHKGKIEVKSKLGEGTTFSIILPAIDDEE
ncbi:MASE3 domain-containing protein [Clostridium sp. WILCCON 0269]|uniref:histidine kinase n=1 Tax=Candidatus Clostridium eludens TaxID=3381663 RepID=A0ABW8SPE3_9CLOT